MRPELGSFRPDELELLPGGRRQRDELELQLQHGRGQFGELRPERQPQPVALRSRVAKRDDPPPRASTHEPRGERELPHRPSSALRPCEQPVEENSERPSQRQLVRDRFREFERLLELARRLPPPHAAVLASSRQAPGAAAVRPQTFGHCGARQPGKLTNPLDPELLELLTTLVVDGEQRERKRCEELARPLVRDNEHLACPRDVRRRERRESPPGRPDPRVPGGADRGERPLQRRLEPAVEPLHSSCFEIDTPEPGRLDREARVLEPAEDLLPLVLGPGRILFDERELRAGRERLAHAHARPHPRRLGSGRDRPQHGLACVEGTRREGRRP